MKALEILYKLDTEYKYAQLNSDSCVRSQFINEAIKELEELNNRSCDGCIYHLLAHKFHQGRVVGIHK